MVPEAVQQNLWLSIRHVVAITVRNEIKVGRRHDPRATESHLDSGHIIELIVEDFPFVKFPVTIRILEDDDSVTWLRTVVWIVVRFCHPQPSAIIEAEPNRLLNIWLACKQRDVKTLRNDHGRGRFFRR